MDNEAHISRIKFWRHRFLTFFKKSAFLIQYTFQKHSWKFHLRLPDLKKLHINAFPAMHLKRLDRMDFAMEFSGELVAIAITLALVGFNFYYFLTTDKNSYFDHSQAAKMLAYHTDLNPKLYAKNTSIITTINRQAGFIAEAQAESFESLTLPYATADEQNPVIADEQSLVSQNPDSIKSLVAKQIKVYKTQDGDTLKSIAEKNGLKEQTLIWANRLPNSQIKPGWDLLIPPVDGVVYMANNNDTLPDLAKRYNVNLDTIIAYNGLENAEDITGGQIFILPGGTMPTPPKPKVQPKKNNDGKVKPGGVVQPKYVDNGTGHIFPWGYCTWYVATRVHVPWGGNAKNWLDNARAYGAVISNKPAVGAIVVTTDNRRYGHVAYVESVGENGFTVSEMNYQKFGKVNTRFIPNNSGIIRGFIHP